ncbi:hypothetical protein DYBT9623_01918 [Dyadobacter sp. CECT 9623]|uniref:Uncharacterized protein n=1 Tax=Dyadobacter linearis TaxID=2823330 RepID=A0ABN7R9N8_9BACT|nr:hypothetical protein [Dyadobacter sp. CECT 9623]CAG5069182.1 hypothetical protein DYBT9623_01918 [Dyadobacter sp. CECT 9623]
MFENNYTLYMAKKSRQEELIEIITIRLAELEIDLLIPLEDLPDEEFNDLIKEAIRLREMLRSLSDFE